MLALTGCRTIGRVRCVPQGQPLAVTEDDLQVATLLTSPRWRLLAKVALIGYSFLQRMNGSGDDARRWFEPGEI